MEGSSTGPDQPLRIIHVLRAPIGGLFRHVADLSRGQIARGHAVGLVIDSRPQEAHVEAGLETLARQLDLGLSRVRIERLPDPSDIGAVLHVARRIRAARPDVVHGHGSKGGALARLSGFLPGLPATVRAYTPHGGSLNYCPGTLRHAIFMQAERLMRRRTNLLLFESGFIASRYGQMVGRPPRLNRVVHNGISDSEFGPIEPSATAADFLYVGELRSAKGIDTLLLALARLQTRLPAVPTLALVGSGPDQAMLLRQVAKLGIADRVTFHGAMAVREALRLGRTMVVPSRAESLPYVVLEAAAAAIPLIATNVGGIPEIFGPMRQCLIPCDRVDLLAEAMLQAATGDAAETAAIARALATSVHSRFSLDPMIDAIMSAYREALTPSKPSRLIDAGRPRRTPLMTPQVRP